MKEEEKLINYIAQNKIDFNDGVNIINKNVEENFLDIFQLLEYYILNSINDKVNYTSESYRNAIKSIPLKPTLTTVKILENFPTKVSFRKLYELPKSEYKIIITALLWIFKFTDSNRRETECKNGCEHFWHNLK